MTGSNQSTAIGDQLRVAREAMGLSLKQAADRLHVDTSILDALETGQFSALGAPVFVRGHLIRYAELLGAPGVDLQAQYAAMQEASVPPDLTDGPNMATPSPRSGRLRWPLIVVAVILVIAVVVAWAMQVKVS